MNQNLGLKLPFLTVLVLGLFSHSLAHSNTSVSETGVTAAAEVKQSSSAWEVDCDTKDSNDGKVGVVVFRRGPDSLIYYPKEVPYGCIDVQKFELENDIYFLSSWADGKSISYRIFFPDKFGISPICRNKVNSFDDEFEPNMRIQNQILEVQIKPYSKDPEAVIEPQWVACSLIKADSKKNKK